MPPGLPARAERLFAAGHAANLEGRPALAVRKLRAAVRLADGCEAEVRGRLLISLAWAEAERGRVDLGLRLLDEAERLLPPAGQALLHAQRAVLLRRNGRNDLALPQFTLAITGLAEPIDLVKALNNRALLHLDGGRVGAAREDLNRAARISLRHDFTAVTAMVRMNLGYLEVVAGDLPAALGTFAAVRPDYEHLLPARLSNLAVETARALIAAGLFGEADRELATAVDQATANGQDHTRADALQARAEAALLAGHPSAAADWAAQARADFTRRGNRRRAALADLLSLRASLATLRPAASTSTAARPSNPKNPQLRATAGGLVVDLKQGVSGASTSTSPLDFTLTSVNGPAAPKPRRGPFARPPGGTPPEADGRQPAGPKSADRQVAGPGVAGLATAGREAAGRQIAGPDVAGPDVAGPGVAGPGVAGRQVAGPDVAGMDVVGLATAGRETAGRQVAGPDVAGPDVAGPDVAGLATAGPEAAGRQVVGPDVVGSETAGRQVVGMGVAGSGVGAREVAGRARRLSWKLLRLGLAEDALVAMLVAARATVAERPRAAGRMVAGAGVPGRLDRLDTRLLWRLARAEVEAAAGRPGAASRELAAGMATLHRYRGRFGSLDLQTGASVHGRDLARAGLAGAVRDGRPGVVFRWSERVRAQALRLPPVRPPDDPEVASALEDLRQTRQAIRAAEIAGQPVVGLRGRADGLQRRIRESAWSVRGAEGGTTVASLAAVRGVLGETVLVSYIGGGATLHALVVDRSAVALISLGSMAAAEEAVVRLRADLDTGAGRAMPARLAAAVAAATRRDAAAMQAALLDPLLGLIGDRALVVVPTGLLMTAPWAMLPACRGRAVTVAPSATAWLAARDRSAAKLAQPPRARDQAAGGESRMAEALGRAAGYRVGMAEPLDRIAGRTERLAEPLDRIAGRTERVAELGDRTADEEKRAAERRAGRTVLVAGPEISRGAEEIAAIAGIRAGAETLAGDAATPAAVLAALDGAGLAHLAAHGRHEVENPLFSALDLAGGPLLGYDLARLRRAPGLVVLASCELGLTEVRPGDETCGMASALLAAGTATVVASVGRVADEAATDAMIGFHQALAAGRAPAEALADAAAGTGFVCLGA
ncbi:hypothetical protein Ate02nite_48320 [Paractinoplanes tereljensis]|uniref:CHAT domain-containing protein n=1 Tax=Paractinoplanes tereljensis TaxID=571912 RepID=A0A919TVM6_9ACTN|nr:CHAT domain-containing protein [Actinoplanes tereljensis]GIF22102.1 hypothetical protein Ate02nite_48320 [Actinoplanes tereljensis]